MIKHSFLLLLVSLAALRSIAQNGSTGKLPVPRHSIEVYSTGGDKKVGILSRTTADSVFIYTGSRNDWKHNVSLPIITASFADIKRIVLRRKAGVRTMVGMGIGAGVGVAPAVVGAVLGPSVGQGTAYIALVTVPLGALTGAVVGATTRKRFLINNDYGNFQKFRKKARI